MIQSSFTEAAVTSPGPAVSTDGEAIGQVIQDLGIDLNSAPRILARVVGLALHYPWRFALVAATSLGAAIFNLAAPRLIGRAIDQAHALLNPGRGPSGGLIGGLALTGLLLLGTSALRGGLQMICGYQSECIGQSVGKDLRVVFFEKLQRLGFDYHDRVHSGELITRGMLDLEGVRAFIENGLQRIISLTLLLGVGCWSLFSQDPILAAVTLSFIPFVGWRAGRMALRLRLAWTRLQERLSVLTRVMEENLQGARVVRAFASRIHEMAKFDRAGDAALALSNQRIVIRARAMATINSSYYLAMALTLWMGAHRVAVGAITIGQLTEFLAFMTILQLPVRQISMIVNSAARAVSSGARVFEILDLEPNIRDRDGAHVLAAAQGVLRFENVRFGYDRRPDAPLILDGVSFTLAPGRTLGVVGPSGAGKSTLAQLIPRFYDVVGGRITLDGHDIRDLSLASLRRAVAVVSQDVFLFDDSIERNIAYADPAAAREALVAAATTAHIHDHAASLPRGYESRVGERGSNLSGGQRQRLSIARGLIGGPVVLVFDDATSAVDAATEHRMRQALTRATSDQATIIISHRLSSLMHADEIIVLDQGRIIERGAHAALLARGGYYARLFALQTHAPTVQPHAADASVRA